MSKASNIEHKSGSQVPLQMCGPVGHPQTMPPGSPCTEAQSGARSAVHCWLELDSSEEYYYYDWLSMTSGMIYMQIYVDIHPLCLKLKLSPIPFLIPKPRVWWDHFTNLTRT